jgi:hypothetical protein
MNLQKLEQIFKIQGTKISVVPFRSYLLNLMDLNQFDQDNLKQTNYYAYIDAASEQGYGYTVIENGKPMLSFGVVPQWKGVAELWLIPDQTLIKKHKIKFHKGALQFMKLAAADLKLHRLHVTVSSLNVSALKWIKSIYFVEEGILKHYGVDSSDYVMFARYF